MVGKISIAVYTPEVLDKILAQFKDAGIKGYSEKFRCDLVEEDLNLYILSVNASEVKKAISIIETSLDRRTAIEEMELAGMSEILLIPVDFSPNTELGISVGFDLAERLGLKPVLIHGYASLATNDISQLMDATTESLGEMQTDIVVRHNAKRLMTKLSDSIRNKQKNGELADLKFSTVIEEGLPEEVILDFTREKSPALVVMSTRGITRRKEEQVGSVTAEVMDSIRVPLLAVPENSSMPPIRQVKKVVFFCNLDRQDLLSMEVFQRIFDYPVAEVLLVPVVDCMDDRKVKSLESYFHSIYPDTKFNHVALRLKKFREEFEPLVAQYGLELLVIPNKRRNVFARLFNPSIAHRILFEKDIPMLVLPI